jgi:hypothetical protein
MNKDALVEAIERAQKAKYPLAHHGGTVKWVLIVAAILLIPLLNRVLPKLELGRVCKV